MYIPSYSSYKMHKQTPLKKNQISAVNKQKQNLLWGTKSYITCVVMYSIYTSEVLLKRIIYGKLEKNRLIPFFPWTNRFPLGICSENLNLKSDLCSRTTSSLLYPELRPWVQQDTSRLAICYPLKYVGLSRREFSYEI